MQKHPDSLENQETLRGLIRLTRSKMTHEELNPIGFPLEDDDEYRPDPKRRRSR